MTATQSWTTAPLPTPPRAGNRSATAGFVLGLLGLLAGWLPVVGLLVTVPALLLSRAGRKHFRAGRAATAGRSGAGLVLGVLGTAICVVMSVVVISGGASATPRPAAVIATPAPAAPVLLTVPNVVGMSDAQAREVLRSAGFTTVVLGPSTGSIAGVAAGTVTTQLPGNAALAAATDPITLAEAAAPPVVAPVVAEPVAAPQPVAAPVAAPQPVATRKPVAAPQPVVAAPRAEAPRPLVAAPAAPASSGGGSFKNCSEARAAGAAPLHRGDAGYRSALDRDGDGVACE
jgi:hypothetical protein